MHFNTPSTWKFVCMCGVGCLLILTSFHYTWGVYPSLIWNSSYNHWLNTVYGQWTKSFYLLPFTILCSFLGPGFLLEHEQWHSFYKTGGTDSLIPPFTTDTFTMGVYLIACNDVVQLYFASKSLICSSNPHTIPLRIMSITQCYIRPFPTSLKIWSKFDILHGYTLFLSIDIGHFQLDNLFETTEIFPTNLACSICSWIQ